MKKNSSLSLKPNSSTSSRAPKSASAETEEKHEQENLDYIKTRKNFILDIIVSTCLETTTHGIIPILKRDNLFIQVVWLNFLVASAFICSYLVSLGIIAYFDYETVTKAKRIHLIATDFPAVTICDTSPFLTNKSIEFVNETLFNSNLLDSNNSDKTFSMLNAENYLFYRYIVGNNALDPSRSDDFRKQLGLDITDMLFSCSYNLEQCTANDFSWFFDSFYGNCFTFNSGKILN